MSKNKEFWQLIATQLQHGKNVAILVVVKSHGSSPGRAGYKMAITSDGELCGSIGGGVMEVELVERAKVKSKKSKGKSAAEIIEQVHRKDAANSSGMICSGKQTVILKILTRDNLAVVERIIECQKIGTTRALRVTASTLEVVDDTTDNATFYFSRSGETEFIYEETLGFRQNLFIIGGGHCALALSELMSKLDFRISVFDDRPELNTLDKNHFADEVTVIDNYEKIADHIPQGDNIYAVVMTLGYVSDGIVIRQLIGKDLKYFGVLGSKAKMAALMKELKAEGIDEERLSRIRTPIGVPINSRTPEEIAISIAAEMIALKNDATLSRSLKGYQNR